MKKLSKNEFVNLEDNVYSVGVDLSIITSLVNFLDMAVSDDLDVSTIDLANLIVILKQKVSEVNKKYDTIECLLDV